MDLDPAPAFGAGLGSGITPWGSWASADSIASAAGECGDPGLGKAVGICGGLEKAAGICGGLEKAAGVCTGEVETGAKSPVLKKRVLGPW